jgi:hypothetical protein
MELVNDINLKELQELNSGELLEISAGCWPGSGDYNPPFSWPWW